MALAPTSLIAPGGMAERIRAFDWVGSPLGPRDTWSPRLCALIDMMLETPQLATLAVGPDRIFLYNDVAARHYGARHPAIVGRPLADAFPHEFDRVAPFYDRVFGGEGVHVPAQPLDPAQAGTPAVFDAYMTPVRDDDGRVIAAYMTGIAVEPRFRAEAALRDSEARFRALVTTGAVSVYRMSPDWQLMYQLDSADFLAPTTAPDAGWIDRYIVADDHAAVTEAIGAAIRDRSIFELEHRVTLADGGIGWVLSRAVPMMGPDGEIGEWFGAGTDITDRKRAQEATRDSEAALRRSEAHLMAAFESVPVGVAVIDPTGRVTIANSEYQRFVPSGILPSRDQDRGWRWRAWDDAGRPLDPQQFPGARARRGERTVPGQEMLYTDDDGREIWTRVASVPVRDHDGRLTGQASVISDIADLKRSEAALRVGKARQAVLLELSDALRTIDDPAKIRLLAMQVLGEHLGLARIYYFDVERDEQGGWTHVIERGYQRDPAQTEFIGRHALNDFGSEMFEGFAHGEPIAVADIETLPSLTEEQRAAYRAVGVAAFINVPLLRGERYAAGIGAHDVQPHRWNTAEIDLIREVAARAWMATERASADAARRDADLRLRTLVEGIPQLVWRAVGDGDWTWASPQWVQYTGQQAADYVGRGWLAALHPDDRAAAEAAWLRAEEDGGFEVEYRLRRQRDGEYRWFQTRATPVRDSAGTIEEWLGTCTDIHELRGLQHLQQTLLAELQHRVRNILAVTRSIVSRSHDGERDTEEYVQHLQGRISALARTQVLLTRTAGAGVDLENLIRDELLAQVASADQFSLDGAEVQLSPKAAEVLTLAVHELATNATKYGAFSRTNGRLDVRWSVEQRGDQPWLILRWTESGVAIVDAVPRRRGFGTELLSQRIPYELKGHGSFEFRPGGLQSRIEFPLVAGDSILQTDGVFG